MAKDYKDVGTKFDEVFRNTINDNNKDIKADIEAVETIAKGKDEKNAEQDQRLTLLEQTTEEGEVLAARGGYASLKERLDALDPGLTINTKTFTATAGQTTISFAGDGEIESKSRVVLFLIDGAPQYSSYTWTNSTLLTMNQAFTGGETVFIQWIVGNVSLLSGHGYGHRKGGSDPLDIRDLEGYEEISAQVDALDKKVDWVDPRNHGAKMDYYLADGTINPSPTDDTLAIRAAVAYAEAFNKKIYLAGTFMITGEIEFRKPLIIEGVGSGYGYGGKMVTRFVQVSGFVLKGTGTKRRRTRRLYRATSADPADENLSVGLNIQCENMIMRDFSVYLHIENKSDNSPTNFGDNWDTGIFVGCRTHVEFENVKVVGYFRHSGFYFDVTHATNLPRFKDINGVIYPESPTQNVSGGDGTKMYNCLVVGAKWGVAVLGGIRKDGATVSNTKPLFYDQELNSYAITATGTSGSTTITITSPLTLYVDDVYKISGVTGDKKAVTVTKGTGDNWTVVLDAAIDATVTNATTNVYRNDYRGTFGFSDFTMYSCNINGTDHHSYYRRDKPTGDWTTDTSGGAMIIDGMAGNASGMIQGMRFFSTRFATWEPFKVKLDQSNRATFFGCHFEYKGDDVIKNPDGTSVDWNSYGAGGVYDYITCTPNTDNVGTIWGTTHEMREGDNGIPTFKAWTATTAVGVVVGEYYTANGKTYKCTVAGTTGSTAPSHTGGTAVDGTVTWKWVKDNDDVVAIHNFFPVASSAGSTTTDRINPNGITALKGELDLRSQNATDAIRFRNGSTSRATIDQYGFNFESGITNPRVAAAVGELDLRSATDTDPIRFRNGSSSRAIMSSLGLEFQGGITNPRITSASGELELRSATDADAIRLRRGSTTTFLVTSSGTTLYNTVAPDTAGNALGSTTKYFGNMYANTFLPQAIAAASAPNGSLFKDSADNKLKYKDNAGVVTILA